MASSRPVVLAWVATIGIMLRPEVRYARAEDGVAIGYSLVGDGPVTIVVVSPLISQLELAWEEPALEHFWSRFAACARVVLFDRRGAGLSDRSPAGERLGLAALALDIEAVLDACDAGQAVLFGVTFGCPVAVGFAASYPRRVQALVLAGGFAKLTRLGEFDFEADPGLVGGRQHCACVGLGRGFRRPGAVDARQRPVPGVGGPDGPRHTCSPRVSGGAVPVGGSSRLPHTVGMIRLGTSADLAAASGVYRRASLSDAGDRDNLLAHPEYLILGPEGLAGGRTHVAEQDGSVVGFATWAETAGTIELEDLFVDPGYMRRGIATALVSRIAEILRARGASAWRSLPILTRWSFTAPVGFIDCGVAETDFGAAPRMVLMLS